MRRLHNALLLKQLYTLRELGFEYSDIKPSELEEEPAR